MIVYENKGYESRIDKPNENWYKDKFVYIVDETTEEGSILAEKIRRNAPYFDFVFDNEGKLIDIVPIEKPIVLPTSEEINQQVRKKIAEKYDYAQEIQMLNKGLIDVNDPEYLIYKSYRQECIAWGIEEKQKYIYI